MFEAGISRRRFIERETVGVIAMLNPPSIKVMTTLTTPITAVVAPPVSAELVKKIRTY